MVPLPSRLFVCIYAGHGPAGSALEVGPVLRRMLNALAKGLFGRVLGYGGILLGFWLLYQAFSDSNPALGLLGGAAILASMYLIVVSRRQGPAANMPRSTDNERDDPV